LLYRQVTSRIFFILILLNLKVLGQKREEINPLWNTSFTNISTKQGLSIRSVTDIAQDAQGIMWVATVDGINRLEGYRIKQFFNSASDKGALFNSDRGALNTEFTDKLWIATQTGLTAFNFKKNTFEFSDPLHKTNLHDQKRVRLFKQKDLLWALGHAYYYKIEANGTVQEFKYSGTSAIIDTSKHAFSNYVMQVKADAKGNLWAINPVYFMKINPVTMRVTDYYKIKDANGDGDVQDIEIKDNRVYIATWGKGLILYDIEKKTFKTSLACGKICKDANFYSTANGITELIVAGAPSNYILNEQTGKAEAIQGVPEARCVLVDKQNNVWFGTDDGVFVSQATNKYIKTIDLKSVTNASGRVDEVTPNHFFNDNSINYATTIGGAGLLQFDNQWNFKSLKTDFGNFKEGFENVRSIYTQNNVSWVASQAGLSKCDKNLNIIKHFVPPYENIDSKTKNILNKIIPLSDNKLFIKGFATLHIFDLKTEKFSKNYYASTDGKHQFIKDFIGKCIVQGDIAYLATDDGLKMLNLVTDQLQNISFSKTSEPVLDMLKSNDTLWLCTLNGLAQYNLNDKTVIKYSRENGLPSDNIRHIARDNKGIIWLATTNGLSAFNSITKAFTNFSQKEGLIDNVLEYGFTLDNDTNLLVGHRNAISIVNTNILSQQRENKKSLLTELMVNGKAMPWQVGASGKQVTLEHHQNLISLYFTVINGIPQEVANYYYKLNDTWLPSATGQVQLNNLAPGIYPIYVSNVPKDDAANDFIILKIKPPYYQTWWFYLLCAIALASFIYAFFKYRANTIRKQLGMQKVYELKLQNLEMQSLRSQMNPHFIFNTLNSINSFIIQNHTDLASEYLTKFSKLMRNILEHSKQETVSLQKELQTLNMYLELESVRLEHKFDYSIIIDKSIVSETLQVPSLIIQPFVENALWHGLHNKKGSGHIQINITPLSESTMSISITDDGIGRKAAGELKKDQMQHKSYGIEITSTRLQLLHPQNSITTTDLYNAQQQASGTKVEIILKTT
jgi:ligand-binding sensor domain-containing protein/two-component sensor histidine kinase